MITSKNGNSNRKGDFKYIYLFTNAQLRKKIFHRKWISVRVADFTSYATKII